MVLLPLAALLLLLQEQQPASCRRWSCCSSTSTWWKLPPGLRLRACRCVRPTWRSSKVQYGQGVWGLSKRMHEPAGPLLRPPCCVPRLGIEAGVCAPGAAAPLPPRQ